MGDRALEERLRGVIRDIPDFPKPGILFRDITPLLLDPGAFRATVGALTEFAAARKAQKIIGVDARGFLFAGPVADRLEVGLVPVRKEGKLPHNAKHSESYALEYGTNTLELHADAIAQGERVVVIDDLLATGGTVKAAASLAEACGGDIVGMGFVIELAALAGRDGLAKYECLSLVTYA